MILQKTTKGNLIKEVEKSDFAGAFKPLSKSAHKGSRGRLVIIGGGKNSVGAPYLALRAADALSEASDALTLAAAGEAAMRAGAGTTVLAVPNFLLPALYPRVTYSTLFPLSQHDDYIAFNEADIEKLVKGADAAAIGPGAGGGETNEIIDYILENTLLNLVIDADALNNLAPLNADLLGRAVLTPHPAEFSRLINKSVLDIMENPVTSIFELAGNSNSVVLLKGVSSLISEDEGLERIEGLFDRVKGTPTLISDGCDVYMVTAGTPKLAKGGSGDVLSGIIGGLAASGFDLLNAALLSAWLLGTAAELADTNEISHMPLDTVAAIPLAIQSLF
ncbi:MAG: ADP-dependent NAD(P)H-hydrate dehydratase [Christensenellales bacterium]|nr:NAD(P)H-hydrate dehydratase [Eubacteriales bacterium]